MNDPIDWNQQLIDQLDWYWQHHFRPRLNSLTDEEYFWEPVAGCWNVHRRGASTAPMQPVAARSPSTSRSPSPIHHR